jgi:hypothetical protein
MHKGWLKEHSWMAGISWRAPTQLKALLLYFSEKNNHTCTLDAAWYNKMEDDA